MASNTWVLPVSVFLPIVWLYLHQWAAHRFLLNKKKQECFPTWPAKSWSFHNYSASHVVECVIHLYILLVSFPISSSQKYLSSLLCKFTVFWNKCSDWSECGESCRNPSGLDNETNGTVRREDTSPRNCQRWKLWKARWGKTSREEMCLLDST